MKVSVFKTDKITARSHDLFDVLDSVLPELKDGCIVAVAGKIVSLCEGRAVKIDKTDKDELIRQESEWYLPREGKYNLSFTITKGIFIPTAGIDESNAGDNYILWPEDPPASANAIREHLVKKHGVKNLGVIITDSTSRPLQWGTTGIAIAFSGFNPLKNYIGKDDLFGRKLVFHKSNYANGIAAAAVTIMGEGDEQTPIALIEDLPFIEFTGRNPTKQELEDLWIDREDDIYWPFLRSAPWQKGGN